MSLRLYHGGVPGLRIGELIEPRPGGDERHLIDGCPTCEARRRGEQLADDDNDASLVYVTLDREYARIFAAGYPKGALYVVQPIGDLVDRSAHDAAPSWGCPAAQVLSVYDPLVVLSAKQIRCLQRRYQGVGS